MNTDPREFLSAFLDGEDVPPDDLSRALSMADSRDLLVDLVLLRASIRADRSRIDHQVEQRIERGLKIERSPLSRFFRPAPLIATAGLAAVLLLVVWFGRPGPDLPDSIEQDPPSVNRVLQFERGVDWHNAG